MSLTRGALYKYYYTKDESVILRRNRNRLILDSIDNIRNLKDSKLSLNLVVEFTNENLLQITSYIFEEINSGIGKERYNNVNISSNGSLRYGNKRRKHNYSIVGRKKEYCIRRSFFSLLKKKQQGKYEKPVQIPKYADKGKGRKKLHYEKGAISFGKEGYVKLSQTEIEMKTSLPKESIRYVEIVPNFHGFHIVIGYQKECSVKESNGRYASMDFGLNNLAAVTSNVREPFFINGKPCKSINQYANKKIAKLKSLLPQGEHSSKQIKRISVKRKNKIKDYFHKASTYVVNQFVSNDIHTLVVGYNKEWKQDIAMGKRKNQNFVEIPFSLFKEMLLYKCQLQGITLIEQEERTTIYY